MKVSRGSMNGKKRTDWAYKNNLRQAIVGVPKEKKIKVPGCMKKPRWRSNKKEKNKSSWVNEKTTQFLTSPTCGIHWQRNTSSHLVKIFLMSLTPAETGLSFCTILLRLRSRRWFCFAVSCHPAYNSFVVFVCVCMNPVLVETRKKLMTMHRNENGRL